MSRPRMLRTWPFDSFNATAAAAKSSAPIGTFTNSTHRQLSSSVRMPPAMAPNAPPLPAVALQMPSARARARCSV